VDDEPLGRPKRLLEDMSIEELRERIEALKEQITACEAQIARKEAGRKAAESAFFKNA
jgi:uncharacterized small protein (DUF1192 family)